MVLLLLPAVNAAREVARRNGCLNNMRSLATAAQNYESAQKRFPTACNGTTDLLSAMSDRCDLSPMWRIQARGIHLMPKVWLQA